MPRFCRTFPGLFLLLIGLVAATGCDVERTIKSVADQIATPPRAAVQPVSTATPREAGDTIKIASFNIQVFGTSKSGKPQVMDVLAKVVRRFDVVAIQEIRSTDETIIPHFVELINADGSHYDHVIGPRLGRTSSKEQYVFIFDRDRIDFDPTSVCTADDPRDFLHREPLAANFRVRGSPGEHPFTFTLVNIHTDPDETDQELDALADVFVAVQRRNPNEDDVILLGDLNVDEHHLGQLGQLPGIAWTVSGVTTNTRGTKSYDNVVFDSRATVEYTGEWGVLNLLTEFGLTMDEALEVSDHMPVWATFSIHEGGRPQVATRPVPPAQ